MCLPADVDLNQVVADWTARLYREHAAVTSLDVKRGSVLYRVFLLQSTLQVDLSFWRPNEFRALGEKFALTFGNAQDPIAESVPEVREVIGMAWLYALHARSSIARARLLQAEYMLSGMRDHVFALARLRHGVGFGQGRGLDDLPEPMRLCAADSFGALH